MLGAARNGTMVVGGLGMMLNLSPSLTAVAATLPPAQALPDGGGAAWEDNLEVEWAEWPEANAWPEAEGGGGSGDGARPPDGEGDGRGEEDADAAAASAGGTTAARGTTSSARSPASRRARRFCAESGKGVGRARL